MISDISFRRWWVEGIQWDTDGARVKLPTEMAVWAQTHHEPIIDALSEETGWCVEGCEVVLPDLEVFVRAGRLVVITELSSGEVQDHLNEVVLILKQEEKKAKQRLQRQRAKLRAMEAKTG